MTLLSRKLHSLRIRSNRARSIAWHRHGGEYRLIFENKHFLSALLRGWGLRTPSDLAILNRAGATWLSPGPSRFVAWPDCLNEMPDGAYFVKPVSGKHGRHAGRLDISGNSIRFDGSALVKGRETQTLLGGQGDFLLQEWIDQHPQMAVHSSRTVNTIRALTLRISPEKIILFHAVMRNGRANQFLDNFHAGGIAVRIDTRTGETSGSGMQLRPRAALETHPDSGKPLAGNAIPLFPELEQTVIDAHSKFPGLRSVGWDVAVTRDGPVIVEGNLDWDAEIHALCDPNFRTRIASLLRKSPDSWIGHTDRG